ncbi:TIR domain-containing protein [Streptomyces sp. NPDC059009]|uniref:TIR domain-containing protein n=1 Tax=Streptomyces sp. NPDC059009 TaxID=3346694 RepID=UPI0036C699B2
MHEIFLNYRTKGGKETAYLCHQGLAARFGDDSVFLAGKSIDPGRHFDDVLCQAVRRSRVLLALVHEGWLDAPDRRRPGRRALNDPTDWVRREIEEAFSAGVLVVPIFLGRHVEQLIPHRLPPSIRSLAACQYARLDMRSWEEDLTKLGDRLIRQVPGLSDLDKAQPSDADSDHTDAEYKDVTAHNDRQSGGIGQVAGSVGTFVNDAHGPLHSGKGDVIDNRHVNRDGTTYVTGENRGGVRHQFGSRPSPAQEDDHR